MYKRLYLVLSIMIFVISVLLVLSLIIPAFGTLFPFKFFLTNFVSLIMLIILGDNIIKNDEDKISRILVIVVLVCMFTTIIDCHVLDINGLSAKGTIIGTIANIISNVLTTSYSMIIPFILYRRLDASNKFSKILKKIGYVSIGLTALAAIYLMIQNESLGLVVDIVNYVSGNLSEVNKEIISKYGMLIATIGLDFGCVVSAYLSEIAFDKGQRKMQTANKNVEAQPVNLQQTSDYFAGDPNAVSSNTAVVMNMGNDLILNSNVGQVDKPVDQINVEVAPVQVQTPATPEPAPVEAPAPVVQEQPKEEPAIIKVGPVINESVVNTPPADTAVVPEVQQQAVVQAPVVQEQPTQNVQQ